MADSNDTGTIIPSLGEIMSWYHEKISRIQHGKRIYNKRYLTDEDAIELFDGIIVIQEKVDDKLSIEEVVKGEIWYIYGDISGKNTVHDHVIKYADRYVKPKIYFNKVTYSSGEPGHEKGLRFLPMIGDTKNNESDLIIAILNLKRPTIDCIYSIIEPFSRLPSRFGYPEIEGLVFKNYQKQLMGKWVNEKFEDDIRDKNKK